MPPVIDAGGTDASADRCCAVRRAVDRRRLRRRRRRGGSRGHAHAHARGHDGDELATLTLSYAVQDPEAAPDEEWSLYDLNDQQPLYVSLVDPVNLRRYKVVHDSDGQALESGEVETKVPNEGSTTAQHTFAAPPADVTEIDVAVGDWPAFRDIPITR